MSVQVLRVRFPGLSVAVSVERARRRRQDRLPPNNSARVAHAGPDRRLSTVAGMEPSLIKLQM